MDAFGDKDPFDGVWTMNGAKSKYAGGKLPKAMTIRMETGVDGVQYHSETTQADGKVLITDYVAAYDGKPAIVRSGSGLTSPVALKRVDARTVEASYQRYQQVVATSRRVLSKDGKTMTVTTVSKDPAGKSVANVGVYVRQRVD